MLQILVNGIISGLLLMLVALGFQVIYKATNIFHIAHGGVYVAGTYLYYWINPLLGVVPAMIFTLIFSFLLGVLIEMIIYKPINSTKSNNQNITLISSLGVYLIIINFIAILAGNETKLFDNSLNDSIAFGSLIITHSQLIEIFISIPIVVAFVLFIQFSRIGLKIRAISNNPVLASVVGLKIQKIRYLVFGLGSILAVCPAILKAYDTGIDPYSGMSITLTAAVVVIVGGNYSIYGTIIASIFFAIIQNYTEFLLSSQWKEPVTFVILILILLWRTEGILQFKNRADEQ